MDGPAGRLGNHAAYILAATFDIDEGASLTHQYPYPTGTDEHVLADLMLPDGAHLRDQDWTIFYLNQVPSNTVKPPLLLDADAGTSADEGDADGARANVRLSLEWSASRRVEGGDKGKDREELLYVINCVKMKKDTTLRRGASVHALALCTPHPFITMYKPLIAHALEQYFRLPTALVVKELFDRLNALDTSRIPSLSRNERLILRASEASDLFSDRIPAEASDPMGTTLDVSDAEIAGWKTPKSTATSGATFGEMTGNPSGPPPPIPSSSSTTPPSRSNTFTDAAAAAAAPSSSSPPRSISIRSSPSLQSLSAEVVSLRPPSSAGPSRSSTPAWSVSDIPPPPLPSLPSLNTADTRRSSPSRTSTFSRRKTSSASSIGQPGSPPRLLRSASSPIDVPQMLSASTLSTSSKIDYHGHKSNYAKAFGARPTDTHFFDCTAWWPDRQLARAEAWYKKQQKLAADKTVRDAKSVARGEKPSPPLPWVDLPPEEDQELELDPRPSKKNIPPESGFLMRLPLSSFDEEVGPEYSVKDLVLMFSPQNPVPFSPPFIPSLHTSGPFTNPIILLINALLTQRRIIFLGHEKPASVVAGSVLAACALGSGGGSVLRGFTERAFPYANLAGLDVLKQVPGYIAGVTNPRFEDLSSRWDVICNIQTGRITVSKDIKPDTWTIPTPVLHVASAFSQSAHPLPPLSSTSAPAASATGGLGSPTESSVGGEDNPAFSESSLVRQATPNFGEDVVGSLAGGGGNSDAASIYEGAAGNSVLASSTSSKGRQQRSDSSASNMSSGKGEWATRGIDTDAVFMDEIISLAFSHCSEANLRFRFTEYIQRFIRLAARYEEETYGPIPAELKIWHPPQAFNRSTGTLGSGAVLLEGETHLGEEGGVVQNSSSSAVTESRRRNSDQTTAPSSSAAKSRRESDGSSTPGNASGALGGGFGPAGLPWPASERRHVRELVGLNGVKRIEGWRSSKSYELWREDFQHHLRTREIQFDLPHQLARLRGARSIPDEEIKAIFTALAESVVTYEAACEVLALTPLSSGGLTPFAFGLFHPSIEVKAATLDFFDYLSDSQAIGKKFLSALPYYQRLAYTRLSEERARADEQYDYEQRQQQATRRAQQQQQQQQNAMIPTMRELNGLGVHGVEYPRA